MRYPTVRHDVLPQHILTDMREASLASPLIGASPLRGTFAASRGFALTFTVAGIARVYEELAFAAPFLDMVLPATRRFGACNAFFLNLLLVPPDVAVGPHVDATLAAPASTPNARPRRVSVLYLDTPPSGSGGELRLSDGARPIAMIAPQPGMLVHFDGRLLHEVLPSRNTRVVRTSLVCEQYRLSATALAQLPSYAVRKPSFSAVLAARAALPVTPFPP